MDKVFVSKCHKCGTRGRVFSDQINVIENSSWSPFKKLLPLQVGSKWLCIACNSDMCRIIGYENDETAYKLQQIRNRGKQNIDRDLRDLHEGKY